MYGGTANERATPAGLETWFVAFALAAAIVVAGFVAGWLYWPGLSDGRATAEVASVTGAPKPEAGPETPSLDVGNRSPIESPPEAGAAGRIEPDGELPEPPEPLSGPTSTPRPEVDSGTATEPKVLRFVYFVEADTEVDPEALELIESQAEALQRYWFEQFGGTFRLAVGGVDIVYGDHAAEWYDTTPNGEGERWFRLLNMRDEVRRKLDLPLGTGARIVAYPNARIDGRVGANRYEGAWMDGDDISCIGGVIETTPYDYDFPASCLGTVAHELGHVYGLGHEGADEDCMQYGFYRYVTGSEPCNFSPANRLAVTGDPQNVGWLDALPGDRG